MCKIFLISSVLIFSAEVALAASANGRVKMTVIRTDVTPTSVQISQTQTQTAQTSSSTSGAEQNLVLLEVIY